MRLSHQPYTGSITMKAQFPHFNLHDITLDQIKDTIKSIDIQFIELTTTTLAVGHLVNGYVTVGQSGAVNPAKYNSKIGEEEAIKDLYRKVGDLLAYSKYDRRHQYEQLSLRASANPDTKFMAAMEYLADPVKFLAGVDASIPEPDFDKLFESYEKLNHNCRSWDLNPTPAPAPTGIRLGATYDPHTGILVLRGPTGMLTLDVSDDRAEMNQSFAPSVKVEEPVQLEELDTFTFTDQVQLPPEELQVREIIADASDRSIPKAESLGLT